MQLILPLTSSRPYIKQFARQSTRHIRFQAKWYFFPVESSGEYSLISLDYISTWNDYSYHLVHQCRNWAQPWQWYETGRGPQQLHVCIMGNMGHPPQLSGIDSLLQAELWNELTFKRNCANTRPTSLYYTRKTYAYTENSAKSLIFYFTLNLMAIFWSAAEQNGLAGTIL
jgi:hypothetical protein